MGSEAKAYNPRSGQSQGFHVTPASSPKRPVRAEAWLQAAGAPVLYAAGLSAQHEGARERSLRTVLCCGIPVGVFVLLALG